MHCTVSGECVGAGASGAVALVLLPVLVLLLLRSCGLAGTDLWLEKCGEGLRFVGVVTQRSHPLSCDMILA